jgi:hypothetical protein
MSRGAWLSVAVTVPLWWAWRVVHARLGATPEVVSAKPARRKAALLLMVLATLAMTVLFVLVRSGMLPSGARLADRLTLQSRAMSLARDHAFTGMGLRTFAAQYSVYSRLGHVRLVGHAHSLPLNLFLEQGPVGLIAYVGLVIVALRRGFHAVEAGDAVIRWIAEAAMASQFAIVIHGIAGDPLYSSRGAVFLFVPVGIMLAAGRLSGYARRPSMPVRYGAGVTAIVLLALAFIWRDRISGWWLANLGALAQSRVELSAYSIEHFQNPTLDQVRRTRDLSAARGYFERAIERDPVNLTARQRLAEMAISQKRYSSALDHAAAAWNAGHRDEATRVLLSDALMAMGRLDRAAELVPDGRAAGERLHGEAWYRYWIDGDAQRAANVWEVAVRLNPRDRRAAYYLGVARQAIADRRAGPAAPGR